MAYLFHINFYTSGPNFGVHYKHKHVKGINILTALIRYENIALPIDYYSGVKLLIFDYAAYLVSSLVKNCLILNSSN